MKKSIRRPAPPVKGARRRRRAFHGTRLRLQASFASRSFAGMRVDVVGEMPRRAGEVGVVVGDAAASLPIKNFLAAIESDDSLFSLVQPLAAPLADESSSGRAYSGDIVLQFRQAEHCRQRSLHFLFLEKLIELLKEAGSQESLEATLCLTSGSALGAKPANQEKLNQNELAVWLRLAAKGDSTEQAVLRWGLGLAHVQQALLFTSRHLRLHLTKTGG